MRVSSIVFWLFLVLGLGGGLAEAREVEVTIDTSRTYQTMEGFGGCMVYYALPGSYTDPLFYDMVVYDLGASIVRLPVPSEIEAFNDDGDPDHINWEALDLEMMAPRMEFLKEFQRRGITRFTASLWSPPEYMKTHRAMVQGGFLRPDMREEFAEFMTIFLRAAKEKHGIEFTSLSLQNELLFLEFYKSCIYNPEQIREAVRAVMRKFAREGIRTRIMMPEELMWAGRMIWYVEPTMADPETKDFPGFFCTHGANTPEDWDRFRQFAEPFGRQLWMTETGGGRRDWRGAMASATAIHNAIARGNVSAWLFWQFTSFIRGHTPGMGYWPAKHFYRHIRPGAVRIAAQTADGQLLATAYTHPDSGKLTAVLINRSADAAEVTVRVQGDAPAESYRVYLSDAGDKWAAKGPIGGGATLQFAMTPNSIVTIQSGEEDDLRALAKATEVAGPEDLERRIRPIQDPAWATICRGAELGEMEWVKRELDKGVSINYRISNGWTPLHMATLWYQKEMIEFLLENGADVNAPAKDGWTPVHAAAGCFLKNTDELLKLYIERGGDVNASTADGWTVLHSAVVNAFTAWDYDREWVTNKVKLVLDAGADVNARDVEGRTPLHWAAWTGWTQGPQGPVSSRVVEMLIEAGADVNARDNAGLTALHYACEEGYERIAAALIAAGADVDVKDSEGRTPADIAAARQFGAMLGLFAGKAAAAPAAPQEPEGPELRTGITPGKFGAALRGVAAAGNLRAANDLLERGADPDSAAPRNRKTALHLAASAGHLDVVKALIDAGANVNAQDSDGFTAAKRARENGHDDVVKLLTAAGAR